MLPGKHKYKFSIREGNENGGNSVSKRAGYRENS